MSFVVILFSIISLVAIFCKATKYKVAILLSSYMLFSLVNIPFLPIGRMELLVPLCFIISEFKRLKKAFGSIQSDLLKKLAIVLGISSLLLIIGSPHLKDLNMIRFFFQEEILAKYLILWCVYFVLTGYNDCKVALRLTFYGMLALTAVGLLNYLTKTAYYVDEMMSFWGSSDDYSRMFYFSDRFRNQSMFRNPFDYGYICCLILLFHFWGFKKGLEKKSVFLVVLGCCLFGIWTCGSRTVFFCSLLAIASYFLTAYNLKKVFLYASLTALISVISFRFIPSISEKLEETISIFDDKSQMSGSTMEGREIQFAAVFSHIKDDWLFGRGYMYFVQDLGWGKGKEYLVDQDLYGLEGVGMNYLLERGVIGLILYATFYILILMFIFRHRNIVDRHTVSLGISVILLYISFANMTGELRSVPPTLLLIGLVLKLIDNEKNEPLKVVNNRAI